MERALHDFDIYPKVVPADTPVAISIRPLGRHVAFEQGKEYLIRFVPMREGIGLLPDSSFPHLIAKADELGILRFTHSFPNEQEHLVRVFPVKYPENFRGYLVELSVYSLFKDLYARRPYMGDHHVHTNFSDGVEAPEIVPSYYRKAGFDYMAVTDHSDYDGSLQAIAAYKDAPIDLKIFPGEEVHAPGNDVHLVNFGGRFSVNAFFKEHKSAYYAEVNDMLREMDVPKGVRAFEYASCLWVLQKIREGGGLGIFCHPHWIANAYHIPDAFTNYMLDQKPFDAFELLGGQSHRENEMQLAIYHDARARGCNIPIVGNSDSHGVVNAEWFNHTKTITFADQCTLPDLIKAIKDGYSVAVDCYKGEHPRLHGPYRMVSYGQFLMRAYFPIHDELCFEEGRAMKDYALGYDGAKELLTLLQGRTNAYLKRCFEGE